ncbi:hypothetical protein Tco_0642909 [Tanacetum coccineum]
MKMEILLEPTSNKLMVEHVGYDESNTYVLERFNTTAGNPVKEILLKLNLHDHRSILKDSKEYIKMVIETQVQFDQALRASLEKVVTASGPGFGDWQWRLATLLIKLGGLGILSAGDIIRYAFLASRLQTSALQDKILMKTGIDSHGYSFQHAFDAFNTTCNKDLVSKYSLSPRQVAILSCIRAPHAQDFLFTISIDGLGQRMNHRQFRSVLCYRLAVPMFSEEDGKDLRHADLLLFNWLQGKDACLDVTCISPFAGMGATACVPGAALHNAVEKKKKKYGYVCEENRYKFIPFAFSMFGEFDTDALDTLSRIKSISISHSNNVKNGVFIFHRVSFCIQKGVGAQLVSRL